MNTKELAPIEPYNEVFFKICLYNSVFPAIRHFGKSILPFLVDDVIIYGSSAANDGLSLNASFITNHSFDQLLKYTGVSANREQKGSTLIKSITESISIGRPVVVWVDCYYESIRPDAYLKAHWPHTLLIYGYNEAERVFNIIEHRKKENLSYEKRVIGYTDLVNAYDGYMINFHLQDGMEEFSDYYEFFIEPGEENIIKNDDIAPYLRIFKANILKQKEKILGGVELIKAYKEEFKKIILQESKVSSAMDDIIENINQIVNLKKVEKYRIMLLVNQQYGLGTLLDSIMDEWNYIRSILLKYKYSLKYLQQDLETCIASIQKIYETECRYNKSLFDLLEEI